MDPVSCATCGRPLPAAGAECPECGNTLFLAQPTPPLPPISGYRTISKLGVGGMGAVHLALDETLGRKVAIKTISEVFRGQGEGIARFVREARAMATVEHPRVVRVYAFGEFEGKPSLVMEYVEGETLSQRLKRAGSLTEGEALRLLRQVLEGLEAAWERGIVHRDIKPSNILLDARGDVHVADFGLAKPILTEGDPALTHSGSLLGTPHYVSPEQARGREVDFRSDIYSLGIVLYEMLAGVPPFTGATPFEVVEKHVREALPDVRERRPEVSEGVQRLLVWMTRKDPEARSASHAALIRVVDGLVSGEAVLPVVAAEPNRPLPPPARSRSWSAPVTAVFLLAAAAFAGWGLWQKLNPPPPIPRTEGRGSHLVVAIAPFYGPDEDSIKEGRVMAALIERTVRERLGKGRARVVGMEETGEPVRDHDAARALGERLGATAVLWGEAFALRSETEIRPYVTLVSRAEPETGEGEPREAPAILAGGDPFSMAEEMAPDPMVVEAAASNQIALRTTSASGVGDVVMLLAGAHALRNEQDPGKALKLFEQTPRTVDSLRLRAEALDRLDRTEEALAAIREAIDLDPGDAQAHALLGDYYVKADRLQDAASAYRVATASGGSPTITRAGALYDGKLYVPESYWTRPRTIGNLVHTGYLLAIDPDTGHVLDRHRLPGLATSFAVDDATLTISYEIDGESEEGKIVLSRGRLAKEALPWSSLLLRLHSMNRGGLISANFLEGLEMSFVDPLPLARFTFSPDRNYDDAPKTLHQLEIALRAASERDPTEPWHLFYLGQAQWWQGRQREAESSWGALLRGAFPAIPYYEYARMAAHFERFQQREWADRAFEETLRRRQLLPQPIESTWLIERLINFPAMRQAARAEYLEEDLERQYVWLDRARRLTGTCPEDFLAAWIWERYFRERNDVSRAENEARVFEEGLRHPLNYAVAEARAQGALLVSMAASLALGALLVSVQMRAVNRSAQGGDSNLDPEVRHGSLRSGVRWLRSLPPWAGRAIVAALAALFIWGVVVATINARFAVSVRSRELDLQNYAILGAAALLVLLNVPSWRHRLPRVAPSIEPRHRRAVVIGMAVALAAHGVHAVLQARWVAWMNQPLMTADSLGNDSTVRKLEERLEVMDSTETRYAAAVVNHLAGNVRRARELYRSIPGAPRAVANLAALEKGNLVPPEPLRAEDLWKAFASRSWKDWVASLWSSIAQPSNPMKWLGGDFMVSVEDILFLSLQTLSRVFLLLGLVTCIALLVIPSGDRGPAQEAARRSSRLAGALFYVVPGSYDVSRGSALRGLLTCALCLLPILAALWGPALVIGSLDRLYAGSPTFPLPNEITSSEAPGAGGLAAWTAHQVMPHMRVFAAILALSAVAALGLHLSRLRTIARS